MKINTNKPPLIKYKIVIIIIAVLLLGLITYGTYAYTTKSLWPFQEITEPAPISIRDTNDVDYSPATEEGIADGQSAKERLLEESDEDQSGSNTGQPASQAPNQAKSPVSITISYAGMQNNQLEIRAFSTSLIKGDGACTATITRPGSTTITRTSPAFIDASSTICEPIYVPRSELSAGKWNVDVTYLSSTHQGSSGTYEVEVK